MISFVHAFDNIYVFLLNRGPSVTHCTASRQVEKGRGGGGGERLGQRCQGRWVRPGEGVLVRNFPEDDAPL